MVETNIDSEKLLEKPEIIQDFPKIELHRHLEGSFDLDTLFDIAQKNKLDVPNDKVAFKTAFEFPKNSPSDFLLFLSLFKTNWYNSFEDIEKVVYNSVLKLKEENIHYLELRFSPEHFSVKNNFDRKEVAKLVLNTAVAAAKEIDLSIKFIYTFNRNKQKNGEMSDLLKKLTSLNRDDVLGIDLAGDEINYPPQLFKDFFKQIKDENRFKIDIHAGEVVEAIHIWDSIKYLHADRIGHGVSSINDEKLQQYLIDKQISLCQCITSNYQTGAWVDEKNHPMGELFRRGVPISISSDDPSIQGVNLTGDYRKAVKNFNFTLEELIKINKNTIKYSFLNKEEKAKHEKSYKSKVEAFKDVYFPKSN